MSSAVSARWMASEAVAGDAAAGRPMYCTLRTCAPSPAPRLLQPIGAEAPEHFGTKQMSATLAVSDR